ncbi:class E sortase [Mycetocola reblochoni]|uniref:Membrane protein n=2 Tax=Mycetocola reblochoni TaxID=331618 RepID=A0A1R4JGE0_9MICO|nr:class E sortase [Mycetocola reblochoni]RLP67726.1 class E sortase [Mycetocola reblochoni]SJN30865.1 Membrane protein [Mycetocola reblochoni REB411]
MIESPTRRTNRASRRRPRPRVSVLGVLGELLLTAGVLVFLFLFWQLFWNDWVVRGEQNDRGSQISREWDDQASDAGHDDPIIPEQPDDGEVFAQLRVPRFGEDYVSQIAGGVSKAVTLDPIGLGHYPDTQMPGEDGNFAIAGHRNTHGAPLNKVAELQPGDAIVVETKDGWFTYRYRNTEYVQPSQVDVIAAVPGHPDEDPVDSVITLTSCNPFMSTAERIISYGVLESWTPRADGPPAALTDGVEG